MTRSVDATSQVLPASFRTVLLLRTKYFLRLIPHVNRVAAQNSPSNHLASFLSSPTTIGHPTPLDGDHWYRIDTIVRAVGPSPFEGANIP